MPSVVAPRHGGDRPAAVRCFPSHHRPRHSRRSAGRRFLSQMPSLVSLARFTVLTLLMLLGPAAAWAQEGAAAAPAHHGGEASLVVPPLNDSSIAQFFG